MYTSYTFSITFVFVTQPGQPQPSLGDRGYTFHEHLPQFALINMNGRVYDPVLGRFLSPDPYVQAPTNTQNYNRYSYCINNPLKYVDLSGYTFWSTTKEILRVIVLFSITMAAGIGGIALGFVVSPFVGPTGILVLGVGGFVGGAYLGNYIGEWIRRW